MINAINLQTVLRNRRFFIFTIVFPAIWFIFVDLGIGTFAKNLTMTWFIISALMGIIGNSIVTFGKRIGNSKEYYLIAIKTTPYTPFRWNLSTLLLIVILLPLGIYFSFVGFLIGVVAKTDLLDMAGFPFMCVVALLIMPFYTFAQNKFFDVVTDIQKIFPGYYVIKLANAIQNSGSYEKLIWLFVLTFVIHVAIILFLFFKAVKKDVK